MLTELHIENIAVIERADIAFGPGLCVLTGETGAGKSIVIDSIDAVLGGRTGRELVRSGEARARVNAVFDADARVDAWRGENGLDPGDGEIILQRQVTAEGKSSCRVDGVPVSAAQLRELGGLLLDLHGQNDGRQLLDESRHRAYLDGFGALDAEKREFTLKYGAYRDTLAELSRYDMDEAEKHRMEESLRYRVSELSKAELRAGEEEELSAKRELLRNSEKLTEALDGAYEALYGGEPSASALTGEARALAERAAAYAPELARVPETLREAGFLLEDAAETLRDFRAGLDFSPEEYDRIETRLSLLRRLEKKYSTDEAGLIELLEEAGQRLEKLSYSDELLEKLRRRLSQLESEAMASAKRLSSARAQAAEKLRGRIESELRDLSMPSARFAVEITPVKIKPGFDSSGCDEVRFLLSANAGEAPGRISRIASGGELSRIMLALKNALAENDPVPTLIFDEIDTGVSGVAAQRVAEKLARLSRGRQVLCVTHLPQIAAMADCHLLIEKSERGGRTFTEVEPLESEGRRAELARLYGGDVITRTALAGAEEQLAAAEKYKSNL